jgi:YVTN family beta-propeller protein
MTVFMLSLSYSLATIFVITLASLSLCSMFINQYQYQSVLGGEENTDLNNNNNSLPNVNSISDNRFNNVTSNGSKEITTEHRLSEQSSSPSATTASPKSGIGVDTYPIGISLNPSTKKIYVANEFSNTVSVVDIPTLKVEKTIGVENFPYAIDSNILNNRVYVTNRGSNSVSVSK